jgi:pimeloyl-[acyl-carrier protein] synthase
MTSMTFDLFSREVQQDPYRYFAAMHEESPIWWLDGLQMYAVSGYEELRYFAGRPDLFSSGGVMKAFWGDLSPVPEVPWLIDMDPPRHPVVRKLMSRAFTKSTVDAFTARIVEVIDELVEKVMEKDKFDLMHDFAMPLPVIIIAELLGVGSDRYDQFAAWTDDFMSSINQPTDPAVIARIRTSVEEFRSYFLAEIEARRREPKDDLITSLIRAQEEDEILSEADVLAMCALVMSAGSETTQRAIANTLVGLFDNPDQMQILMKDRTLVRSAIEEGLRYYSPILGIPRIILEDVNVAGVDLKAGQMVLLMWGMANRDPRHYENPDRFDVKRNPIDHLAFGFGNHFCLGAPLARREASLALERILFSGRTLSRLNDTTEWYPTPLNRGPLELALRWDN